MNIPGIEEKEKIRKERAKKAVALAMQSRWEEAVLVNRSILKEFPQDMEAHNRLGKALSELGRNKEAKEAFRSALEISPHNSIARKNLDRLMRLGDDAPGPSVRSNAKPQVFIEESGKAGVTSLVNLASPNVLLKMAPGHPVQLQLDGSVLKIADQSGEYAGQVEPRLASRLVRLIKGGNQYDATVTSVSERELTIIIREVSKHPSQTDIVSFPLRNTSPYTMYVPSPAIDYDLSDDGEDVDAVAVKDWSNDDTEPGDDEAFSPVFHRIINNPGDDSNSEEGEDF